MHLKIKLFLPLSALFIQATTVASPLPQGFVYLKDIDPTILQDIRYAGDHNFLGRPVKSYNKNSECILTTQAATALKQVQAKLKKSSQTLKVYDCYRPQTAVNDFIAWSKQADQQQMKAEFYPSVNKADVFKLGYVAEKSGHSRGSTIDLTIVSLPTAKEPKYHHGQKLISCIAPYGKRFHDNSLDMGTGFDCFNELAHADNQQIGKKAYANRVMFQKVMGQFGFIPYENEWWHFTLKNEPFPETYFDFPTSPL